jgi:hypothetical protein
MVSSAIVRLLGFGVRQEARPRRDSWGMTSQGVATRKAPVRTEPHSTSPILQSWSSSSVFSSEEIEDDHEHDYD